MSRPTLRSLPFFQHASLCIGMALLTACSREAEYRPRIEGASVARGQEALRHYECGVCHVIPGVRGAKGRVGPPLASYSRNVYVAGKFPNVPDVLVRWVADAPAMAPATAMPAIAMSEGDARDIAAYLYSLH